MFCFYHCRKLKTFIHRMRLKLDKNMVKSRWEEDYELIENEGLFEEYLEMGLYSCFKPLTICLLLTDFVVYSQITFTP